MILREENRKSWISSRFLSSNGFIRILPFPVSFEKVAKIFSKVKFQTSLRKILSIEMIFLKCPLPSKIIKFQIKKNHVDFKLQKVEKIQLRIHLYSLFSLSLSLGQLTDDSKRQFANLCRSME